MSEKLMERRPTPGPTATETPGAALAALSPAERAEREIAKLDEEMDQILGRQSNREALVNPPGQVLQPPQGRSVTPGVSGPIEAKGVNHLAMNVFVPGLGSLAHGNYAVALLQFGLVIGAVPTLLTGHLWLALGMAILAYAWSIVSGIGFLGKSS
jgi:hypothetical protein